VTSETTKKCPKCGSTEIIKHELSVTAVRNDGTKQVEANKFYECKKCKHQWWDRMSNIPFDWVKKYKKSEDYKEFLEVVNSLDIDECARQHHGDLQK